MKRHQAILGITGYLALGAGMGTAAAQDQGHCNTFICGGNSPLVGSFQASPLSLDGTPNPDGVSVVRFESPSGNVLTLDVVDGRFVARDPSTGAVVSSHDDIVGFAIFLDTPAGEAIIRIVDYDDEVPAWAPGLAPRTSYGLSYDLPSEGVRGEDLCLAPAQGTAGDTAALLIRGEDYDIESKSVIPAQPNLFTIACAGDALAKMKLLGYDPEESDIELATAPVQRQATIKMLAADYCGSGTSYTELGQPLYWQNAASWFDPPPAGADVEAIWDQNGAVCLNQPRLVERGQVACALPTCEGFQPNDWEWVTYLPL